MTDTPSDVEIAHIIIDAIPGDAKIQDILTAFAIVLASIASQSRAGSSGILGFFGRALQQTCEDQGIDKALH